MSQQLQHHIFTYFVLGRALHVDGADGSLGVAGAGFSLLEGQDTGELGEAGRVDAHVRPIGEDENHLEHGCRFCRQGRGGLTGPPRELGGHRAAARASTVLKNPGRFASSAPHAARTRCRACGGVEHRSSSGSQLWDVRGSSRLGLAPSQVHGDLGDEESREGVRGPGKVARYLVAEPQLPQGRRRAGLVHTQGGSAPLCSRSRSCSLRYFSFPTLAFIGAMDCNEMMIAMQNCLVVCCGALILCAYLWAGVGERPASGSGEDRRARWMLSRLGGRGRKQRRSRVEQ
jgi:hypothetical protein